MNKNIKKITIAGLIMGCVLGQCLTINAEEITIKPTVDKEIKIFDLANKLGQKGTKVESEKYGSGYSLNLNDNLFTFYENSPYVYVNGYMLPIKTKKIKDSVSKEEFNIPDDDQKLKKDGDDFLIPKEILVNYLGFKEDNNGIKINAINVKDQDKKEEDKNDVDLSVSNEVFRNKLEDLGWKFEGETTYKYKQKSNKGDWDVEMGIVNAEDKAVYFGLFANSEEFDSSVMQCFKLLLPNKGEKLFNIVKGKFEDQTLNLDGKKVEIWNRDAGISVYIYNK
ncbi:TPA: S-layer protein [Clostridioides difficile]|nr:S-layer protein [Clostridioides difficile]MDI6151612.1 S-layer protein [Clostridioides difficile]MDI7828071.1 S-layer protein [Clostridioides difficile]